MRDREGATTISPALFGRDEELRELSSLFEEAVAGSVRVVLLAGEPGIGKTTLADALCGRARESGARTLWGRAVETGGAPAFWPWVQVLRAVLGPDALAAAGSEAPVITRLLPELRGGAEPFDDALESDAARFELFDAFARLLARSAGWSPLVVVLDDLHASDLGSLRLLHHCAREVRDVPLMIVGTYRDAEVRMDPERAEAIGRISREARTMGLRGLDSDDVSSFLMSALGTRPPQQVVGSMHELTGGNPLFLREVVRLLAVDGRIDTERAGRAMPEGVRETIRQRLRPLGAAVRDVLEVAAVAGVELSVATLASASGEPAGIVVEALDTSAAIGLVHRDPEVVGRYRFAHALVREALYEEIAAGRRAELHRAIASGIESAYGAHLDAHLSELAHHYYQAARAGRGEEAIAYSVRAGAQALASCAYEEAVTQYRRAMDVMSAAAHASPEARCDLLLSLSEALWKSGEQERAREAFAEAAALSRRLGEPVLLARAALGFGAGGYTGRTDARLVALLEDALAALREAEPALRARLLARFSLELYYADLGRARALSAEALAIARDLDDPATLGYVLNARRNAIWGPDDLEARTEIATEVARLAERHGYRELAMEGHAWRILALAEAGDEEAIGREVETLARIATELRQPFYMWELELNRAARAAAIGALAEAEQLAQRALEIGTESRIADVSLAYGVQLFFIRDLQGRLASLEGSLEGFFDAFPQISALRTGIAYARAETGRIDDARALVRELRAASFSSMPRDRHWLLGMALLAGAVRRIDEPEGAAELYELLVPFADRIVATTAVFSFGAASHHLGLLAAVTGRTALAKAHLEDALARHISARSRPWAARSGLELARLLLDEDAPEEGRVRSLLRTTLETAGELGMSRVLQEARELYAGVQPPRPDPRNAPSDQTAILFTDLVSSTQLMERIGDDRAHEVMRAHHRIVRKQIAAHGGEEMRFQGDGFMVTFRSSRLAVACAAAIQADVAAYSRTHPETPLDVRAGIHAGVPIVEDGELHGRSVVVAARIADAAGPGEVLVSARVREIVGDAEVLYAPGRTIALKGFGGTHTVHPVVWG